MSEDYQAPSGAEHPITPPPELVRQWLEDSPEDDELGIAGHIATQAARWGADQELEACCEWVPSDLTINGESLRDARRPEPPSLKEQALEELETLRGDFNAHGLGFDAPAIRRALETLDD